jgi:hypothetical protein
LQWSVSSSSGSTSRFLYQKIEDVRTFAGQTVTFSFWGKTTSGTVVLGSTIGNQNFGTGGSAFNGGTLQNNTLTTTWQRFTQTATVASVAGKTIGAGSNLEASFSTTNFTGTIQIWGVQLEAGSTATAFQTATGTVQGELAACQRYYYRATSSSSYGWVGSGIGYSTTTAAISTVLPVQMRVVPSAVEFSTLALNDGTNNTAVTTCTIDTNQTDYNTAVCNISAASGIVQYRPYYIRMNASASAYIGFTAEL